MSLETYTQLNSLSLELESSLQELSLALDNELQYLQQKDIAAITNIARHKRQLSEKVEYLEKQCISLIAESGIALERNAIAQFIHNAANSVPALVVNWQKIDQLGKLCADKNQVNGMILESNRRNIESRLAILRGQSLTPDSYARNGKTTSTTFSKSLAQV